MDEKNTLTFSWYLPYVHGRREKWFYIYAISTHYDHLVAWIFCLLLSTQSGED